MSSEFFLALIYFYGKISLNFAKLIIVVLLKFQSTIHK